MPAEVGVRLMDTLGLVFRIRYGEPSVGGVAASEGEEEGEIMRVKRKAERKTIKDAMRRMGE